MNKNLLILCDSTYGDVAKEIAESMQCFDKISILDVSFGNDNPDEKYFVESIGNVSDYESYAGTFGYAIAAFDKSEDRLEWTKKLADANFAITSLISQSSIISRSAQIHQGCIIEPFTSIGPHVAIDTCTIIESGAVVHRNSYIGNACRLKNHCVIEQGGLVTHGSVVETYRVVKNYEESMRISSEYT